MRDINELEANSIMRIVGTEGLTNKSFTNNSESILMEWKISKRSVELIILNPLEYQISYKTDDGSENTYFASSSDETAKRIKEFLDR